MSIVSEAPTAGPQASTLRTAPNVRVVNPVRRLSLVERLYLREIIRGRTTLIIAHRLHTLRRADRILVFDQGRLVEQGRHEALMAKQGLYWQMFTASPDWQGAEADRGGEPRGSQETAELAVAARVGA